MCNVCKMYFHNLCGYQNHCSSEFYGEFKSYCHDHVTQENIPPANDNNECGICYELMSDYNPVSWITTPCCNKGFVHLLCQRKVALNAGYFLKCIFCGEATFRDEIKFYNVFVPDRDALWEKTGIYKDLYIKNKRCDHRKCVCPYGRDFNVPKSIWAIYTCQRCSMKGFHQGCKKDLPKVFTCNICNHVLDETSGLAPNDSLFSFCVARQPLEPQEPTKEEIADAIKDYVDLKAQKAAQGEEEHFDDKDIMPKEEFEKLVNEKVKAIALLKRHFK